MKKTVCPYCNRKISYFRKFVEHNFGEHECKHCNKKSNIKQASGIWALFALCVIFACLIMIFYLAFADSIMKENAINGSHKFLMAVFFGKAKILKWFLWELVPFALFYFLSPLFMTFVPQQRFVEQTTTSIDLNVPKVPLNNTAGKKQQGVSGSTKVIATSGDFSEEIQSNSGNLEKTRAFDVNNPSEEKEEIPLREGITVRKTEEDEEKETVNVTPPPTSVSNSYRDDSPLRKIPVNERIENSAAPQSDDVKEYVPNKTPQTPVIRTAKETEKPKQGNFSANRKF